MGTNREIKSDGNINITSTQTNISGHLDVTGSINDFNFPASDGINGQALVTNGSGTLSFADAGTGGSGGINYVTNTRATADTTGYATYADAAATTPADGTGGSANTTFTRNTTTPLRDGGDFKIAKDAANRQGEGVGYAFTIDSADKARKLVISFDYDASHASYADDDIKIFIYDVTNTNLIRVNGEDLKGGKGKHYAQFQAASNSTSYRLIFHVSSTNASAYNVFLDEISVGPQTISHGTIVTDWESWTPTGSWSSNTTYTGYKKRIGDTAHYLVDISTSGAPTSADLDINMPSGEVIDTDKLTNTFSQTHLGRVSVRDSSESDPDDSIDGKVFYKNTTSVSLQHLKNSSNNEGNDNITQASPITFGSGDRIVATWSVPIVGYSSNAKTSEDLGGRDVVFIGNTDAGPSIANTTSTVVDFINIERSTHGAYSGGTFTVPESGTYQINSNLTFTSTSGFDQGEVLFTDIKVGGVTKRRGHYKEIVVSDSNDVNYSTTVNASLSLNKGDQVTIEVYQSSGGAVSLDSASTLNFCDITKIASPQTILENETVAFISETNAGQSIPSATNTTVDFEDVEHDSHNAYSSGTYTVPVTGLYQINAATMFQDTSGVDISEKMSVRITVNGSGKKVANHREGDVSDSDDKFYSMQISSLLSLNKGDTVTLQVYQSSGGALTLYNDALYNYLDIHKIK